MVKVVAVVQARMSSSRLPGKVLRDILGEPMLSRQLERIQYCKKIDKIVVATSDDVSDDPIEILCRQHEIACFRGSLNDLLDRNYNAALVYGATHIVRLTGDCPLMDSHIVDLLIEEHFAQDADYSGNAREPSFPDGLDVEIFSAALLERAWKEAILPSEREHITQFFLNRPDEFKFFDYQNVSDLSHMRWTVDEEEDFVLITKIFTALYPHSPNFTMVDVLACLDKNPDWHSG